MWTRRATLARDGALAAGIVAADLVVTLLLAAEHRQPGFGSAALLSAVCALPVVLRRAWPGAAVAGCLAALALVVTARVDPISHTVAFAVVGYTIAARLPLRRAGAVTAVLWLPVLALDLVDVGAAARWGTSSAAANTAMVALVAFLIGRTVYHRGAAARALQQRAHAAELNQAALSAQAVADERRRIARELHDVLAHNVSVIGVLATGARRVLARDPQGADQALQTIEETSRTTLREMRRLLDVLRTDAEEPDAQLTPQPGLGGIESLVEQVREAGLPVRLRVEGEPVVLDEGVALTVFRIVQEALTNTLQHAGTATATVLLRFTADALTVEVGDTGLGPAARPSAGVGHGIVGMRERIALYGGSLRTGPRPGGGFAVRATIPADQLAGLR